MLAEKYRPRTLDEVIGQEHVINSLKQFTNDFPHLLFVGPPGCGKTTIAHAFARERGYTVVELNASDERGIDTIRNKVKVLAKSAGKRIILLDEADALTVDAQQALRRIIENAAEGVRFILTANFDYKLIDPIKSRCTIFFFRRLSEKELATILLSILQREKIPVEVNDEFRQALITLVRFVRGDARKAINLLETMISQGKEITPQNILLMIPYARANELLTLALEDRIDEAIQKLEDYYIENKFNAEMAIDDLYATIKDLQVAPHIKYTLYDKLADVERNIKLGCSPLIQFAAFLATAWVLTYGSR